MDKIPTNYRSKCYFGCEVDGPLHHFPNPKNYKQVERFNAWRGVLDIAIQTQLHDEYIYNALRLCNRHFETGFIVGKKLTQNAIPTLNIIKDMAINVPTSAQPAFESSTEETPKVLTINSDMAINVSTSAQPAFESSTEETPEVLTITSDVYKQQITSNRQSSICGRSTRATKQIDSRKRDDHVLQQLSKKVLQLTKKCKSQTEQIREAKKLSKNASFLKIIEKMPEATQTFLRMQLKINCKAKGRRFTIEEKVMAASILKQGAKAYNFLRKILVLPSKRSVQRLLLGLRVEPGINENIMKHLKQSMKNKPIEKRLYTLLFDELALSPGLYFNGKEIVGFENCGGVKNKEIADHALVFMIKGVKTKTKQPIAYTFCKSATKKYDLKKLIVETIVELQKAGLIIVATICDQATTNVAALKLLLQDTKAKYLRNNEAYNSCAFEVNEQKIFPLFDTPHLLKGLRNNFLTKDIEFQHEGKVKLAKWEHLKLLLDADPGEDEIRIINKLTEYHVDPEKIPKMKVLYAAQVFSRRVSSVMRFLAKHNQLPAECADTADFLLLIDKLFDSFNGHSYGPSAKILKGCLKNNSPHIQFWNEIVPILKSIKFIRNTLNRDGTRNKKVEKVPSVQNWIQNIETFKEMWQHLNQKFKVKNLITRSFNQDPLENFFSSVRSNGVRNINPTCNQFKNSYKTLLINNINSPHSVHANCEKDDYKMLQSMKFLITENCDLKDGNDDSACNVDSLLSKMNEMKSSNLIVHVEAKKYVAGYVIKKCKTKIFKNCKQCLGDLQKSEIDVDSFNYAVDFTKKSLFNACDKFIDLLNEVYSMIIACLRENPESVNLKRNLMFYVDCGTNFSIINCSKHKSELIDYIVNLSINVIVHSWCKGVNKILIGKIVNFDQDDGVKSQAFNYYKSRRKNK